MKNLLFVDDNELLLLSLADWFGREPDFRVLTASNGREAAELLDRTAVDFILTDLQMPVMDGFDLIEHRNGKFPDVPLFVMTAVSSPLLRDRLRNMGVLECIEKPFDLEYLMQRVRDTLRRAPAHRYRQLPINAV